MKWVLLTILSTTAFAIKVGNTKKNSLLNFPIIENGAIKQTRLTIDANWRWVRKANDYTNCFNSDWDRNVCPNPDVCNQNCVLEGVEAQEYKDTYGVSVQGNAITLRYVTVGTYGVNVGSRLYLLEAQGNSYFGFNPLNREISFDADVSQIGCGLNGAVYTIEVPLTQPAGEAGSDYGIGYGDAQSPRDIKFVNNKPNTARLGVSAFEFDIVEINNKATHMAIHNCKTPGIAVCNTDETCGVGQYRYNGPCDADGGYYNPYQAGNTTLYGFGSGFAIDTSKPFTVKTQFITNDGTDTGTLVEIRRVYVQNGKTVQGGSLTDASISRSKSLYNEINYHQTLGGMHALSDSFKRKHALVISLWDDSSRARMLWLDGTYPPGSNALGSQRGPCPANSGDPAIMRQQVPNSQVTYSNFQINRISNLPVPAPTPSRMPSPTPSPNVPLQPTQPQSCSSLYAQCGGLQWRGPTCCVSGSVCKFNNDYYSQCLPSSASSLPPQQPSPTSTPSTDTKWVCNVCVQV